MKKVVKNQVRYKTFIPSFDGFIGTGEKAFNASKLVTVYEMKTPDMKGVTRFIGTTETKDRDGEIVKLDAWDFTNYVKNPVVLWGHDHKSLPIGKTVGIYKDEVNKAIYFDIYITDGYDFAKNVKSLVEEGILKATSVGFRVLDWEWDDKQEAPTFTKTEMFEISIVNVPANQDAILQENKDIEDMETKSAEVIDYANVITQLQTSLEKLTQTVENLVTQNSKPDQIEETAPVVAEPVEPVVEAVVVDASTDTVVMPANAVTLEFKEPVPTQTLAPEVLSAIVEAVLSQINQPKDEVPPTDVTSPGDEAPAEPEPGNKEPEPAPEEEPKDEAFIVSVGDLDELDEFIIINEEEK